MLESVNPENKANTQISSESSANAVQDTLSSDSRAIRRPKSRTSTKPPMLKAAVIAKRSTGTSKLQISKDLGIARNTVDSILNEGNYEQQIEAGKISCISLIPKGAQAIEKAFNRGDGALAVRMFEGLGILGNSTKTGNKAMGADLHLQQAINVLIQPSPSPIAVPQNSAIDTQVIDNKGQAG